MVRLIQLNALAKITRLAELSLANRGMEIGRMFGKFVLGDFHQRCRKYGFCFEENGTNDMPKV